MIVFILILAFFIRIIRLDQSLWLDEATQAILSSGSIHDIIFSRGSDFHPPLSYLLLHFWLFFGTSEIWLRLLSVLFGVMTVWITYLLASKIFNKRLGILSAFLLCIGPYHIYYSQEVRMYAQATFFATLSVYFFYNLLQKESFRNYLGYILATSALMYTHYEGIFLIFSQLIYLTVIKKNQIRKIVKSLTVVFVLYLPWLPQFFIQLQAGINIDQYLPGWRDVLTLSPYKALPLTFLKFSLGRINFDNQLLYALIGLTVLTFVAILLYRGVSKLNSLESKLFLYWLAIPLILSYLISFKIPINQPFRILFVLPAFYILLANGLENFGKLKNLFIIIWIVISLSGLGLYSTNSKFLREDWRGASQFVVSNLRGDGVVMFAWPEPMSPYQWYGEKKQAFGLVKNFPAKEEELEETLKILENRRSIYFFEYLQSLSDPKKLIQKKFNESGFKLVHTYDFRGVGFIDYFER